MHYLLLIYGDPAAWARRPEHERAAELARHADFARRHRVVSGTALVPDLDTATVSRHGGRIALRDGPFGESTGQLGGWYVLECESKGRALAAARDLAGLLGDEWPAVEVRPLASTEAARVAA